MRSEVPAWEGWWRDGEPGWHGWAGVAEVVFWGDDDFLRGRRPVKNSRERGERVRKCLSGVLYGVIGVGGPFDTIFFRR